MTTGVEASFASLQSRLRGRQTTGQIASLLEPAALIEAKRLLLALDGAFDPDVYLALGTLHQLRAEALANSEADAELSLRLLCAVQRAHPDRIRPELRPVLSEHPMSFHAPYEILNALGRVLLFAYGHAQTPDLLDHAIDLCRCAMRMAPDSHPSRTIFEFNLGSAMTFRFGLTRSPVDLSAGIAAMRSAVDTVARAHPNRSVMCEQLAAALRTRFLELGDSCDLEAELTARAAAVDSIAETTSLRDRLVHWYGLTEALWRRFLLTRQPRDIDQAVGAALNALAQCPASDSNVVEVFLLAARVMIDRYDIRASHEDIDRAVTLIETSLRSMAPQDARRVALEEQLAAVRGLQSAPAHAPKCAEIDGGVLANRALRLQEEGRLEEAVAVFLHAIPVLQSRGQTQNEGRTRNTLGATYALLGRFAEACKQHEQAVALLDHVGDTLGKGRALCNLAADYIALGRFSAALEMLPEAIRLLRAHGDLPCEGNAFLNLGRAHQHLGNARSAFMAYDQAASIFGLVGDREKRELACRWRAEQRVRGKEPSC